MLRSRSFKPEHRAAAAMKTTISTWKSSRTYQEPGELGVCNPVRSCQMELPDQQLCHTTSRSGTTPLHAKSKLLALQQRRMDPMWTRLTLPRALTRCFCAFANSSASSTEKSFHFSQQIYPRRRYTHRKPGIASSQWCTQALPPLLCYLAPVQILRLEMVCYRCRNTL